MAAGGSTTNRTHLNKSNQAAKQFVKGKSTDGLGMAILQTCPVTNYSLRSHSQAQRSWPLGCDFPLAKLQLSHLYPLARAFLY
jgi:hypothetical protein